MIRLIYFQELEVSEIKPASHIALISIISGLFHTRYLHCCSLASERSELDTIKGNSIENRGYLFIYMGGHMYVICTLTLDPIPNFTKPNLLV